MFRGKRELLAGGLYWSGAKFLLDRLPARDSLVVLNYHRIGVDDGAFDSGVFCATDDQFNEHISYLKRRVSLVTLEEALDFVDGRIKEQTRRCRVLLTFDDGYLDNYKTAFPILASHGVKAVFFLVTDFVGSCHIPWWDDIAYVMKTARQRRFTLHYPFPLQVDIRENGMSESVRDVLGLYKSRENKDPARFTGELRDATNGQAMPRAERRFLNWDEAREMIHSGMAIGSHTRSHPVLSQLEPQQQLEELAHSQTLLREQLGCKTRALAYPVGNTASFSSHTERLARDLGYRAAFSFYGGTNLPGRTRRYDIRRISVGYQSRSRFRIQTAVCRLTGCYWP